MHSGYYKGLADRLGRLVGRDVVFYRRPFPNDNIEAYFEGLSYVNLEKFRIVPSEVHTEYIESACKDLLERYFINDGNLSYGRWLWLEDAHIENLRSRSFQELDIKLTLIGVQLHMGYYKSLASRLSKIVGRSIVFFKPPFLKDPIDADFDGFPYAMHIEDSGYLTRDPNSDDTEIACRLLIERYFVNDGNQRFSFLACVEEKHLAHLRSTTFQELDIKLTLLGF